MVDVLLLIATIVLSILMFGVSFYIFVLYCHPEEKNIGSKWFYKILIIFGWGIVFSFILILPLDVANSRDSGSGLNIDIIWIILNISLFVLIGFLFPFAIVLYEEDEDKSLFKRIFKSFIYALIFLFILGVLALIAFGFLNVATFPVNVYNDSYNNSNNSTLSSSSNLLTPSHSFWKANFEIPIPSILFIIIFLLLLGWFLFVCFFGIGLTSLPMDLILDYIYRPKLLRDIEKVDKRLALRSKSNELINKTREFITYSDNLEEGKNFLSKWKKKREKNKKFNTLKKEIFELENEVEIFKFEENLSGNIIFYFAKLTLGIICTIFSLFLLLHIIIYVLVRTQNVPASNFLNNILTWTEVHIAPFFSTILFALLGVYIMMATINGNFKFGFRILIFWKIHPMRQNGTWMNSFLFNVILILLCCLPTIHFCTDLFSEYVRLTSTYLLFGALVRKLKFFSFFFDNNIFYYILIGWSVLTCFYLLCKSKKDRTSVKKLLEKNKLIKRRQ